VTLFLAGFPFKQVMQISASLMWTYEGYGDCFPVNRFCITRTVLGEDRHCMAD